MAERQKCDNNMSWCDLQSCMHDIQRGLIQTRLKIIAPHKPVVATLATMLHPCDVLALRAAYEGYTRLFAHGRWHANMPTQWFHGNATPEHTMIYDVCCNNNRYDLLEKLIGVMPANELFTTYMFAKACERNDVKSVDICARVLTIHKIVRPYTNKLWHGKIHACGGESGVSTLAIKKRGTLYLHQLTKEMVMLPSVRALLACASPSEIASGMTPSRWKPSELDPDVCELLKTIYTSMVAAGEYVTAREEDIKKYNQSADGLEEEYLRVLLSDFQDHRSPRRPEYGSFKFVDDTDSYPLFADVPEDLKTAVCDRVYVGAAT